MKPSLVFMMRLSGSVKFFALWRQALRMAARRPAGLLRPSACRRSSASLAALAAAAGFRLGLQFGLGRADLLNALLLVGHPFGHLVAALVAAEGPVLLGVRSLGRAQPPLDLGLSSASRFFMRS